jgi:hypothetical protein
LLSSLREVPVLSELGSAGLLTCTGPSEALVFAVFGQTALPFWRCSSGA